MGKLKFHNISSAIDLSFWHILAKKKLEEMKLEDQILNINGYYSTNNNPDIAPVFRIISDSFNENAAIPSNSIRIRGLLKVFNTKEDFISSSKPPLLQKAAEQITSENLVSFILLVYADLKNFVFTYWVGFPVFNFNPVEYEELPIQEVNLQHLKVSLAEKVDQNSLKSIFGINKTGEYEENWGESDIICYLDPASSTDFPSSVLRNILGLMSQGKQFGSKKFLAIKNGLSSNPQYFTLERSKLYNIEIPETTKDFIGWEANSKGKIQAKTIDLRPQLDPHNLATSAVDLNLKLMRWRMSPELNLDILASTKCLLLGSGTLGSQLSRNLLAWGMKNITFVDSGKVSYSNPVRQSLYEFEDAKNAVPKALRAAKKLQEIYPGVQSSGYQIEIPMPGHSISSTEDHARENYLQLESLIKEHDVVFLLTDSRESRWLPTVITSALDKICLSVALGFDSFLVVRHGGCPSDDRLGCYFCNDVVAPRNSMTDRTLDQQCTVTRPGLSYMASSVAVELLVSLLQHPLRHKAKHGDSTHLGILPHHLRGSFSTFGIASYVSSAFSKCTACCVKVIDQYLNNGFEFVKMACNDPDYLEEVCELKELEANEKLLADELIEIEDFD
ncbi:hypothetical protein SteCoe_8257 [Stentor coeruleus]|uniref:Ubiquitin-like modifier-activating enzyme ATG7 n=1 Tax=Stentor coeruleus TaxID=5963 RepID=A0A1R2CKR5_9CILI|nr:hypothetical protein SteCoe_8257 [Stentor coeruleus]